MTADNKNTETREIRVEPRYVLAGLIFSEADLVNIETNRFKAHNTHIRMVVPMFLS